MSENKEISSSSERVKEDEFISKRANQVKIKSDEEIINDFDSNDTDTDLRQPTEPG